MPHRLIAARELGILMGVLAHPERICLIEELQAGERDVATLQAALGVAQSKVSKHLSMLRAHRIVAERREGRHVIYRLAHPDLAAWVADGLTFVKAAQDASGAIAAAADASLAQWGHGPDG